LLERTKGVSALESKKGEKTTVGLIWKERGEKVQFCWNAVLTREKSEGGKQRGFAPRTITKRTDETGGWALEGTEQGEELEWENWRRSRERIFFQGGVIHGKKAVHFSGGKAVIFEKEHPL